MGMLSADENDDPLDVRSWHQHPEPVFRSRPDHGVYGPGHDSFFVSLDGTEEWFVYHAKTTDRYTYEGRTGRPQGLTWRDGVPDFGLPLPLTMDIPLPAVDPGPSNTSAGMSGGVAGVSACGRCAGRAGHRGRPIPRAGTSSVDGSGSSLRYLDEERLDAGGLEVQCLKL
jgi:hypothetical protein